MEKLLLSPEALSLILKYVQLAIAAAPQIAEAVARAKDFITQLFTAKLITAEVQNALHTHVDNIGKVFLDGQQIPQHWLVSPDPITPNP